MLDPAAHDVPSGLSQSLTGTHAGPLLPGEREREMEGMDGDGVPSFQILKMIVYILWSYLCGFFFFIMFAETPECPKTHTHTLISAVTSESVGVNQQLHVQPHQLQ